MTNSAGVISRAFPRAFSEWVGARHSGARRLVVALVVAQLLVANPAASQSATSIDSTFRSDSARLGYTMQWPAGDGPFPLIVLVHGSGRTTRDEMANIVPRFLERGFAVMRYDKRGVGVSEGEFPRVGPRNAGLTIPQLARDAAAGYRAACAAPRIAPERCGFFGASQAGWVISEALRSVPAAFAIVCSGTTVSVAAESAYSQVREHGSGTLDSAYQVLAAYRGQPGYDPIAALSATRTPMLWLLGLADESIPARVTRQTIDSLRAAGRPFVPRAYEGYGHGLGESIWPDIDVFLQPFRHG